MAWKIKTIKDEDKPRAYVTIEEVDGQGNAIGRVLTEPFDMQKKDWPELKARFKARIDAEASKNAAIVAIISEGNDAKLTNTL